MAQKGVGSKNKRKETLSKKRIEKKITKHNHSKDGVTKDEDGLRGNLAKSKRSNAVENAKVNNALGGTDGHLTRRNSVRGVRIVDEKTEEKISVANKSSSAISVKFGRVENALNQKVVTEENSGAVRTPAKRRRNVEKKIAETIVSSNAKSSYNLRARRGTPSFRKVDLSESGFDRVVGKRVKVFRPGSRKWYTGKIELYDDKKKFHKVVFDGDETQELDLKMQRFELEVMLGEAYTLSSKHEHMAGRQEMVGGDLVNGESVKESSRKVSDADPVKKYSKPTRKVVTKAANKGGTETLKRKDTAKRRSARLWKGEDISDGDMVISELVKEVRLEIKHAEPEEKHPNLMRKKASPVAKKWVSKSQKGENADKMKETEKASLKIGEVRSMEKNAKQETTVATKAAKERRSKSRKKGSTEDEKSEDVPSQEKVSNGVSDAQTQVLQRRRKAAGQINVESRKNPVRKLRANFEIRK